MRRGLTTFRILPRSRRAEARISFRTAPKRLPRPRGASRIKGEVPWPTWKTRVPLPATSDGRDTRYQAPPHPHFQFFKARVASCARSAGRSCAWPSCLRLRPFLRRKHKRSQTRLAFFLQATVHCATPTNDVTKTGRPAATVQPSPYAVVAARLHDLWAKAARFRPSWREAASAPRPHGLMAPEAAGAPSMTSGSRPAACGPARRLNNFSKNTARGKHSLYINRP